MNDDPPGKKKKLPLSLKKKTGTGVVRYTRSTSRFAPPVTEVEFTAAAKGVVPTNTKKTTMLGRREPLLRG